MPCVGGNGVIDRIAYEEFESAGRDELATRARDLLQNDEAWHAVNHRAGAEAQDQLSFRVIADKIQSL